MNRRLLLSTVSASLALAGCAGRSGPGTEPGSGASPTVSGEELSRTGDCDDPDTATVTFGDDGVAVAGCISGPNGCAEAALEDVAYLADEDTLCVTVGTVDTSGPNEACTEAIVYRAYELDVEFAGGLPGTVVVVHRGAGDEVEAARVER